jgi:uroporphyrinogen-III synthase
VTRPETDAERTAVRLRRLGHTVVFAPMLRIEPIADSEIGAGPWAAILVTSANAAVVATQPRFAILHAARVFAVGGRSAEAMRDAGFVDVTSADGNVDDLARLVVERLSRGAALLYLAGADRTGDLAGDLVARGFDVRTVVIYRAVAITAFTADTIHAIIGGIDGVLHYSRRSAQAYVDAARAGGLVTAALEKPMQFSLSTQVAEPLAQLPSAHIRIAAQPSETALLALIPEA